MNIYISKMLYSQLDIDALSLDDILRYFNANQHSRMRRNEQQYISISMESLIVDDLPFTILRDNNTNEYIGSTYNRNFYEYVCVWQIHGYHDIRPQLYTKIDSPQMIISARTLYIKSRFYNIHDQNVWVIAEMLDEIYSNWLRSEILKTAELIINIRDNIQPIVVNKIENIDNKFYITYKRSIYAQKYDLSTIPLKFTKFIKTKEFILDKLDKSNNKQLMNIKYMEFDTYEQANSFLEYQKAKSMLNELRPEE